MGWSLRARLFHWVTVIAITVQWIIGLSLLGGMAMAGNVWLTAHLSLGLVLLALTLLRLGSRIFDHAPRRARSPLAAVVATLGHAGLYALLLLVPLTGWLGYRPAPFMPPPLAFGLLPMPVLAGVEGVSSRTILGLHALLTWVLVALVALHGLAALFHAVVLRDGVLGGMLRGRGHESGDRQP
ncbi:cytochrome b [Labrys sp. ZIDIC5]|uniref:cytochrome b n=1 Tax=Labrys sedimenti TaxID=3106036 RepID=UPI002ACA8245|nr:cytochrome b/b6 domain-containing protein [Labrys sp. ZIDIC5]MDZ5453868.1 cytochrome b/b6 domain-containing protein [Labrys sp. ZIDIC5]